MYTPALHFVISCLQGNQVGDATTKERVIPFMRHLAVWGVEPVVTHQTSWLESTGVRGVRQNQAGGTSVRKRA